MPLLALDLKDFVAVERHDKTQPRGRLGERLDVYIVVQQAQGRIFQKTGKPKFGMAGRTDDSTHSFLFNATQVIYPVAGNPFVSVVTYPTDIKIGDRILYYPSAYETQYLRVDNVINIANDNDHFEARLTLCLPGGES